MRLRTQAPRNALQAGFTLIELIIVIVIIGILAAVAIPKFQDLTTKAQTNATKAVAGELASAAAIYYAKKQIDPTNATSALATCTTVNNTPYLATPVVGYSTADGANGTCIVYPTAGSSSADSATFSLP